MNPHARDKEASHTATPPTPSSIQPLPPPKAPLNCGLVGDWRDRLGLVVGEGENVALAGHGRLPLELHGHTLSLGLLLELSVLLDAAEEVLA
jgi:hypothetical protein